MSLPLHTFGTLSGDFAAPHPLKVLPLADALTTELPFDRVAIDLRSDPVGGVDLGALHALGFAAALTADSRGPGAALPIFAGLRRNDVVAAGDVIGVTARTGRIGVLYRRGADSNSLFVTERCNSLCLMCSQPPRNEDDSWRVAEALELLPLIDRNLPVLGITGGEPTLLGEGLTRILVGTAEHLPDTHLHILTNGRRFADRRMVTAVTAGRGRTTWAVPIYADTAARHDQVVQAPGSFEEALEGIHNLAEAGHRIEVRFVAHALTVPRIMGFAEFVWRNLPFAEHVALMGLEPMGLARRNRDVLWIEPAEAARAIADAARHLATRGMAVSIYNTPLCLLPRDMWPLARRSISDWKQVHAPECEGCSVRDACAGFFLSADASWRGTDIRPVTNETPEPAHAR
ncbi:His-Xaa-Ser system radical SAM maturase HxsC [Roseomonas sp. HJA6]|uniref:His-Xaa-Ser system radical SAM maturase HxsC n=1 Tax=Roseomonas alba TaxID=2846776 RepID=A0ABS7A3Z0_9PROT|nr:His-Xaa-Ser system radical SAM maturase HxsC [Neoroseomonas alba]MBW6397017.1 His-Xaa-Ser system radical SAM maturase HxsC [Neoroseomonas alba]